MSGAPHLRLELALDAASIAAVERLASAFERVAGLIAREGAASPATRAPDAPVAGPPGPDLARVAEHVEHMLARHPVAEVKPAGMGRPSRAAMPSQSDKPPAVGPKYTPERDQIIAETFPAGVAIAEILRRVNALPGPPMNASGVYYRGNTVMGLQRPYAVVETQPEPRKLTDAPPETPPKRSPEPEPQPALPHELGAKDREAVVRAGMHPDGEWVTPKGAMIYAAAHQIAYAPDLAVINAHRQQRGLDPWVLRQ